jgi:putative transposon-encoded protein
MARTMKDVKRIEFKTIIHKSGNSGHIFVPFSMIGKEVSVSIEVLD